MRFDSVNGFHRLRALCLFTGAMLVAFMVPLTVGQLTAAPRDSTSPPHVQEDSIVRADPRLSSASPDLAADSCQLIHLALAGRGGADTVNVADLVAGGSSARAAMAAFPSATMPVSQILNVTPTAPATSAALRAARSQLDRACRSAPAAPWGTSTAETASFKVPFFVKAISAGAAQLATWLAVSSACVAAFNVAAIGCKPLADFVGGFIGALVFQSFDNKFGHITKGEVLNSFVSGLGAVPLGVIGRSGASHLLGRIFGDAGRWLQDSFLYHVPANLRAHLGSDIHGLAGIGA